MIIKVSILGASGYTGIELIRLLVNHPNVQLKYLVSETYNNQEVVDIYPHLSNHVKFSFSELDIEKIAQNSDLVFLALPHTKSMPLVKQLLGFNCKIIDLSADLWLNDGDLYTKWYQHPAADDALLKQAIYGLAEIGYYNEIINAQIIANPGCYPTATLLGLAPLLKAKWLDLENLPLIIDAKSGISGAGRGLNLKTHFCEAINNFSAYQIAGTHRHIPEIEQELTKLAKHEIQVQFTPHLIPTPRGLLITAYCHLNNNYTLSQIKDLYLDFYKEAFFVRISTSEIYSGIKSVIGSNFCNISVHLDYRTNYLVIVSTIDNLLKGASGQAIQNMNLMFQLKEYIGLEASSIYP